MSSFLVRFDREIKDELRKSLKDSWISFLELVSFTDNFADENLIVQGSSVKCRWGRLLLSGELIDIVIWEIELTQDNLTEIMMLCLLKHKNIFSILYNTRKNEYSNIILFINKIEANGSLAEHLLSGSTLTWTQRLSICIGVGQALKCIHYSEFVQPGFYVIHGNIKSSEILLDYKWQPKLQDFESAMVAERNTLYVTSKYKGTLQYKDPTYEKTGALTGKSDVFSFGVVLSEVLFGRKAAASGPNEQAEDNWNFAEFTRLHWKNKTLDKMIDPDMRKNMDSKSIEIF